MQTLPRLSEVVVHRHHQPLRQSVGVVALIVLAVVALRITESRVWDTDRTTSPPTISAPGDAPSSSGPSVTQVIEVHAILELPSPTPTPTPRPSPTPTPDPRAGADFCEPSHATPGALCRVPYPPPPTPTPIPDCRRMSELDPGDWCAWSTVEADDVASNGGQDVGSEH